MSDSNKSLKSPVFYRGRFYNHTSETKQPFLMHSLYMLFECFLKTEKKKKIDKERWFSCGSLNQDDISITWIGHSTFLIKAYGVHILTDPVFGNVPLFKRQLPPGIEINNLPKIDYIVISHNHRDHMDEKTLRALKAYEETHILVPHGDKAWFIKRGYKKVSEFSWWNDITFHHPTSPVTFTFLPALHWSQRGIFDFNKSLWGSWMISVGQNNIYFAGDTAYSSHFEEIAKRFDHISFALMPIAPCEPRKWMSATHMSAEEAGQAFIDLQAQHFIPMHWGTFSFGTDNHEAPYERLMAWWRAQKFTDTKQLTVMKVGQCIDATAVVPLAVPAMTEDILRY